MITQEDLDRLPANYSVRQAFYGVVTAVIKGTVYVKATNQMNFPIAGQRLKVLLTQIPQELHRAIRRGAVFRWHIGTYGDTTQLKSIFQIDAPLPCK